MSGTIKLVPLLVVLILSSCSSGGGKNVPPTQPAATAPSNPGTPAAPTQPTQIGAVSGVDISGCWQIENGKSKISFTAIGTDLYVPSYGDDTAWQVEGNKFNEISNPFKMPAIYPAGQKHSVGAISADGTSLTRNLVASPTSQTFLRCP